ncbi:MAG: uracil-DNA glycosylase family protein [Muribaculaceae bacterium]|nr:uracil-DNA glycosylase family protein [Muribaculaceae bacterium]
MEKIPNIEPHPWQPFIPDGARIIMLGTFPPKPERWSMDFFYPNKINDMWRIMGIIFYGDRNRFWIEDDKRFDLDAIKAFLYQKGIALWDTAMKVRRLNDNASDKFLEIVETIDLESLLRNNPTIAAVVTAGEKATGVVAKLAGVDVPATGHHVKCRVGESVFTLYRMPSSSRAYPLPIDKKADAYREMFRSEQFDV